MERLTKMNESKTGYFYPQCFEKCGGVGNSQKCDKCDLSYRICDKLGKYEDLEEQGMLLKNPQELKNSILERMKEFMDEYRGYSKSSIDHFGGKADAMETAMRIVNAAFSDILAS